MVQGDTLANLPIEVWDLVGPCASPACVEFGVRGIDVFAVVDLGGVRARRGERVHVRLRRGAEGFLCGLQLADGLPDIVLAGPSGLEVADGARTENLDFYKNCKIFKISKIL